MAKVIKEGLMNVYEGFRVPFKADTAIYCVYVTDNKIDLTKIPAMSLLDMNGLVIYRLPAPYFVDPLVSTEHLDNRYINQRLQLKNGFVIYYTNKTDAETFAREIRSDKINQKKSEIEQLKAEIDGLLKSKITFDK